MPREAMALYNKSLSRHNSNLSSNSSPNDYMKVSNSYIQYLNRPITTGIPQLANNLALPGPST
jgi:hypothetical protein